MIVLTDATFKLYNEVNTMSKEMGKLRYLLQQKEDIFAQLNDEKQKLQRYSCSGRIKSFFGAENQMSYSTK